MVDDKRIEAQVPSEQSFNLSGKSRTPEYMTLFMDHKEGEGIFINTRSILRMRIERKEVYWTKQRFEAQSPSNVIFANWSSVLANKS